MKNQDILDKISKSFSKVLEHNNFTLTEITTANDVDGWESITHMMIINDIEQSFNIKFKLMDLMNMDTIGDLVIAIEKEQNLMHS
ncbi:acyl carrier protein [Hyunsoonleella sp. 2307UL5-6]|uniref:acyl carrier protein n=1 Tax=Hyunsoonleella sp. 2307UL5-6 TaxID=3384768 RepID=UPI0039BD0B8A